MKNLDFLNQKKKELAQAIQKAIESNDKEAFDDAFTAYCGNIEERVIAEMNEKMDMVNNNILMARGQQVLTTEETEYYQKLAAALKSDSPMQALADIKMPQTTIDRVFDDIQSEHPILAEIHIESATGLVKIITSKLDRQSAEWGKIDEKITKELAASFNEIELAQNKLSAFIPVSKAYLDLGPIYLDKFVRTVLEESFANGLEDAVVDGTGKNMPIGMTRNISENVSVTGGEYPKKTKIKVTKFDRDNLYPLCGKVAKTPNGGSRIVTDFILVCNPEDYWKKVKGASEVLTQLGTYVNSLPINMKIVQSPAVTVGEAVFGVGKFYDLGVGMDGKIAQDDSVRFLDDERVYLEKGYANGRAKDDAAFLLLDITKLEPTLPKVETVTTAAAA